MSIDKCSLLSLTKIYDPRGSLTFIQNGDHIPFDIERVYYLYDVPAGESRGGHAHKELTQVIIAVSGSFDIEIDDGANKRVFTLNRPYVGLYISPMIWREIRNFSSGSVCLVLASSGFNEDDYYRDYCDFLRDAKP
jgi:hypothetical protein